MNSLLLLKYGFCRKSLRKNGTLTSADLEKKLAKSVQLVRVSFFVSDFLQNPYFKANSFVHFLGEFEDTKKSF